MVSSMSTLSVPNSVKPRFDAVVGITDAVCRTHLTEEYAALARELAAALARKRPSPLMQGRPDTWACGVTYTIGAVNFLFDPAQTPHLNSRELCALFGVSQSACAAKTRDPADLRHRATGSALVPPQQARGQPLGLADPGQRHSGRYPDDAT
jgi:hypothetical protein